MKLLVEARTLKDVQRGDATKAVDGVLLLEPVRAQDLLLKEILALGEGPLHVTPAAVGSSANLLAQARALAALSDKIVVSLPFGVSGLDTLRGLTAEGISSSLDPCRSALQALLAAKAGASFVSVSLAQQPHHELPLVREILALFANYNFETQLLCGSLQHLDQLSAAGNLGVDGCCLSTALLEELVSG